MVDELSFNVMKVVEAFMAGEDCSAYLTLVEELPGSCEEDNCNLQVTGFKT